MNVVNFGSLNLDHVYAVDHFCRAGETIHTAGYTQNAGGKGLNQSIAVARSGQTLCHAGMLGAGGEPLAQLLEGCGVDLRYLGHRDPAGPRHHPGPARRTELHLPLRRLQPGRHAGGHRRRALALCPGRLSADAE